MPSRIACCDEFEADPKVLRVETPDEFHKAKLVCFFCGKFHKWAMSRENMAIVEERAKKIDAMLEHPTRYNSKELDFLQNIKNKPKITPKQFEYFNNLFLRAVAYKDVVRDANLVTSS